MKLILKILSYILGIVLLLLIATAAVLYFIPEKVITTLKPTVEKAIGQAFDADVSFEDIALLGVPNLTVVISNSKIIPHQGCCSVTAQSVSLDLNLHTIYEVWRENADSQTLDSADYAKALTGLSIDGADWQFETKGQTHQLHIIKAKTELLFDGLVLNLISPGISAAIDSKNINLTGQSVSYSRPEKIVYFQQISSLLPGAEFIADGTYKIDNQNTRLNLKIKSLKTEEFSKSFTLLTAQIPAIKSDVSGDLIVDYKDSLQISGNLYLKDFSYPSAKLTFSNANLKNFIFARDLNEEIKLKSNVTVNNFSASYKATSYKFNSSDSNFTYSKNKKGSSILSDSKISDFSYVDGKTSLEKTTADLKNTQILISRQGDFSASLDLDGSALTLNTAGVTVNQIQSVKAPLKISFPKLGGYSISGPVNATGVQGQLFGKEVKDARALVSILISSPVQRYTTNNFQSKILDTSVTLNSDFSITKDAFIFAPGILSIEQGSINYLGTIKRTENQEFTSEISAKNVSAEKLTTLMGIESSKESRPGTIQSLDCTGSGKATDALKTLLGSCKITYQQTPEASSRWYSLIHNSLKAIPSLFSILGKQKDQSSQDIGLVVSQMTFKDGGAQIDKFEFTKNLFSVIGSGRIEFDGSINLNAQVIFFQQAFASLGLGIAPIAKLFGRIGRISIPIIIQGGFKNPELSADIEKFLKDNSGLNLIEDTASGAVNVGTKIFDTLSSPFARRAKATPVPAN